jgi:hypothetical protein
MSKRVYNIVCLEEADYGFKQVYQVDPPTQCPNNPAHAVNSDSIYVSNTYPIVTPVATSTSSASFSAIGQFMFTGSVIEFIASIQVVSSGVPVSGVNPTSYDIKITRIDTGATIAQANFTNNNYNWTINDMGAITNVPANDAIFEIQAKRNGPGGSVSIKSIILNTTPE